MEESTKEEPSNKKDTEVKTFTVPLPLEGIKKNITISSNIDTQLSKEKIINQAFKLHSQGNILEAAKYYQHFIDQGFKDHQVISNYGTILQSLGKFKEAVLAHKKAIEINPNYAMAHFSLGSVLKDMNQLKEAELATRKAIEIKADHPKAHANLGGILKDLGKLEEAELYTRKALQLNENLIEAKLNLETIKRQNVPGWHIPMMNDKERNNAYLKAIKIAIKENENVLEIGTGSGLLSMMAIDAGAKEVITCEAIKSIAEAAKRIISKNGYEDKIKVIHNKSTDLLVGKELPKKADLIISEILSSEFVGEGVQNTILDAKNRLLKKDGKMIPEEGEIKLALLKRTQELQDELFADSINGYDLSDFNEITGNKLYTQKKNITTSFLSNEKVAFSFNFYSNEIKKRQEKILEIHVLENGICLGLITWIKLNLYKDIFLDNHPILSKSSHWINPIYTFKKPLKVSRGEILKIKATLLEDNVWFELIE